MAAFAPLPLNGNITRMKATPPPRPCELHLTLAEAHTELVRGFIREAALAEGIPLAAASLVAGDGASAWQTLAADAAGGERARIIVSFPREDVRVQVLLPGHARFAGLAPALKNSLPQGAGLSFREHGVDGWELTLDRSPAAAPQVPLPEPASPATAAAADEEIEIGLAREEDAAAIARCFLSVYGHHYVHSYVFSPRRYWARVAGGELIPVVARNAQGEVIGHVALEREPGAVVAERGEAVVLPAYRGHHLLERMTERLSQEAASRGLEGIYAEPLTIHTFSQRNDARAGMPVCAVLLGANPEDFRPKDIACPTAGQRQSYLRTFRFVKPPAPRTLQASGPYRDVVLGIYASLGVSAGVALRAEPAMTASRTGLSVNDRGYGVIRFDAVGSNCGVELAQALRDLRSLGACSIQLAAHVDDPGLPLLTEAARGLGFFFCGLGPAFAEGRDLLLLQRLTEPLDTAKLQIFTDETRKLLAFIDTDRAAVAGA